MATGTKSNTAKTAAAKKTAAKRPASKGFDAADLPTEGKGQYRGKNGTYRPSITALLEFAKSDDTGKVRTHVKALTHLGWVIVGGDNEASKSKAFEVPNEAGLPASQWAVGKPAAPQIAANMNALAEAGAPADALADLWAVYTRKNADADVL